MSQFIEMFGDKGYPLAMIKSFADVSTGGTPSKAHPEYWNGNKPWVSAEDMKSKYVYDTCEKVTDAGFATCKIIPMDTLMYVCRGSIGVMAINKIECATNQSICRATCHDNVCNVEFLYHALMYKRDNIKKMGTGTSFKSLNQTTFSELEIELPPYDEQMKFVEIANQADKSEFVGFKSQFIEMFYNGKYTVDKLREHIDVIRGVSYKPSDVYETHNENTSIVLRSNNIEGGQINFDDLVYVSTERVSELQLLRVGDIVMCGSNGSKKLVGKAAMLQETPTIRTSFGAFCLGIRCKLTLVPEYLATYFQTSLYRDEIEQLGSGSNILNIKPDHIYDLEVPIPLYDEQMAFVSIVRQADKSEYYN